MTDETGSAEKDSFDKEFDDGAETSPDELTAGKFSHTCAYTI